MKKLNILKSLIMVMAVLLSTGKAFCEATAVQASYTLVQSTVAVEKNASQISGNINPSADGESSILSSSFELEANDEATFFVVYSAVQVAGGQSMSAFDEFGNIMFANTSILPTESDIYKAKANEVGNANVIVYPFKLSGDNITATFTTSKKYNECYKVTLQEQLVTGILTQTLGGKPLANTYSTRDQVGTYKTTVYVEAVTEL